MVTCSDPMLDFHGKDPLDNIVFIKLPMWDFIISTSLSGVLVNTLRAAAFCCATSGMIVFQGLLIQLSKGHLVEVDVMGLLNCMSDIEQIT